MSTPPDVELPRLTRAEGHSANRFAAQMFVPHVSAADLGHKAVRGAAVTGTSQACKFALRLGSTAILARLLTPEDYGLVAMTSVVVGLAGVFKDAGLTSATVQRQEISHEQISTLFWINVGIGCLIALLLVALAPLVGAFYKEPRLEDVTIALAITFILSGLSVQHQALLRRQMRYKALALIEIASMACGITLAIYMAASGFGYWSLVGLSIGISAGGLVGVWLALRWTPGLPRRRSGVGPLLKFGGDVLSFNVVNLFSRQSDALLIGWFWGPVALGFYDRAYNMLLMPIRQINAPFAAVAVPALSRARTDEPQFKRFYLNSLQLVSCITVPLVLVLAIYAEEIVRLWLGPDWSRCATLFRLLALAAAIGSMSNPIGWLLVSLGHTRRYKQMGLFTAAVTVASFAVGLPFGPEGVATAYSCATLLLFVPTWLFVLRGTGILPTEIFGSLTPALFSCIPATLLAIICARFLPFVRFGWFGPLLGIAGFATVYMYLLFVRYERWDSFRGLLREFRAPAAVR